jgi:hypothetical protein
LKNFLLLILFFIIVGYAYITISEHQKQRLIRERRPRIQEMVDKYEFKRALYQIRQTREKTKGDAQDNDRPEEGQEAKKDEKSDDDGMQQDMEALERMKSEPSTPAQPIERPEEKKTVIDGSELRRGVRSRFAPSDQVYDYGSQGDTYQRPVQNPEQLQQPQPPQQTPPQPPQPQPVLPPIVVE